MQKILKLANDDGAGAEVVGLQTRQLLYAVHKADTESLAKILSSSQATQKAIHEIDCRYDPQGSTVLSVAIHLGQAEIIKALLDYCEPLSLAVAVQEDFKVLLPDSEEAVRRLSLGRFPEWWSLYQPKDPSAIALRALLDTEGNGEAVFYLLMNHGLQITDAVDCDIGRCLWFWAVRKGYTSIVEEFLKNNFPIGLRSSRTGYHHLSLSFEKAPSELSRYSARREYEGLAPLGTDAIWNASQTGHLQVLSLLINKSATLYSKTHELCANDKNVSLQSSDTSTARIEYSIDPFLAVCDRYADRKEYDDVFPESRTTEYISVIRLLLEAGADPNIGPIRSSPLDSASLTGFIDSPPDLMPIIIRFANLHLWDLVNLLLEHGADVRSVGNRGRSLAHCAVEGNNISLLSSLLGKGLEADAQDLRGFSLVQEAVRSGSREALEFLIQCNANVNSVARNGTSALILAIDKQEPDLVRDLLQAGADVNQFIFYSAEVWRALREEPLPQTDERYVPFSASTPLLAAVNIQWLWRSDDDWKRRQDTQSTIVDILLDNGAIPEQGGFTELRHCFPKYPISLAVTRGCVQSLRHLIRAVGPRLTRWMTDDAMRAACVMQFRFVKDEKYWRASQSTVMPRSAESTGGLPLDETNILLDAGANPNVVSCQGLTPLHVACTAKPSQVTLVKRLVQLGADVNIVCPDGKTALHYAAMFSPETLPILLDARADCFQRDDDPRFCGWKAMQYACAGPDGFVAQSVKHLQSHHWEDSDIVRFVCAIQAEQSIPLITRMVDSNWPLGTQDGFTGESPVHISCKNRSDGPIQLICRKPRPWYVYAIQTLKNETPLILAAKNNSAVKIDLLLRGVRISETFDLDKVYYGGPENCAFTKHACSFIDDGGEQVQEPAPTTPNKLSLRERSFILNAQDPWGWTALHHAADHGNEAILRLLVAEPNIDLEPPVTRAAPTPMALAKATGNTLAVTVLAEAKASRAKRRKKCEEDKMMQLKVKSPNRQDAKKRLVLALKIAVVSICVAWLWKAGLLVGSLE